MKVEERYGFDTALDIDDEVWKVLPKIQARGLKSLAETSDTIEGLRDALELKLDLEGFSFEVAEEPEGFAVTISRCPWHDAMVRSGRRHLSGRVGTRICNSEYTTWASEFGGGIRFELGEQICEGSDRCVLKFSGSGP